MCNQSTKQLILQSLWWNGIKERKRLIDVKHSFECDEYKIPICMYVHAYANLVGWLFGQKAWTSINLLPQNEVHSMTRA